ncbi:DegV family protein [Mycoplasmatota bacterium]|nr:DegV family protein [Mycoplasmatota bacterium]
MNKVLITTDSTCDLSNSLLEENNIKLIPLHVIFDDEVYYDRVNITTEKLYDLVNRKNKLPKTAAASSGEFYDFFKPYIDEGYDIVFVGISSKFSSTIQSAKIAASEFEEGRVHIVDSLNLSTGVGLVALKAAKFAQMGLCAKEVAEKVREIVPKVETAFVIDTMEYLYKGGRCSGIAHFVGTVLKIKPIIHVVDGGMLVGAKPRGINKAYDLLLNKIFNDKDKLDPDFVMVTHSLNFKAAKYLKEKLSQNLEITNLYETTAGCVISSHCGRGTIGILYITK